MENRKMSNVSFDSGICWFFGLRVVSICLFVSFLFLSKKKSDRLVVAYFIPIYVFFEVIVKYRHLLFFSHPMFFF